MKIEQVIPAVRKGYTICRKGLPFRISKTSAAIWLCDDSFGCDLLADDWEVIDPDEQTAHCIREQIDAEIQEYGESPVMYSANFEAWDGNDLRVLYVSTYRSCRMYGENVHVPETTVWQYKRWDID